MEDQSGQSKESVSSSVREVNSIPESGITIGKTVLPTVIQKSPPCLTKPRVCLHEDDQESFHVWIETQCFSEMVNHVSSTPLEAGGIMVGHVYHHENVYHVQIEASITSNKIEGSLAGLRFTFGAWEEMLAIKDLQFPGFVVVGWYHSHPLMHVGMSGWDITLHQGFFREPWQMSLITDPYFGIMGIYRTAQAESRHITAISLSETRNKSDHQSIKIGYLKGYIVYSPQPHPIYGKVVEGAKSVHDFLENTLGKDE